MGAKKSKHWLQLKSQQNDVCKQLETCLNLNLNTSSGKIALERTVEKIKSQMSNELSLLRPLVFSQNSEMIRDFTFLNKELEGIYLGLNRLKSELSPKNEAHTRGSLIQLARRYRQNLLRKEQAFWDKIDGEIAESDLKDPENESKSPKKT